MLKTKPKSTAGSSIDPDLWHRLRHNIDTAIANGWNEDHEVEPVRAPERIDAFLALIAERVEHREMPEPGVALCSGGRVKAFWEAGYVSLTLKADLETWQGDVGYVDLDNNISEIEPMDVTSSCDWDWLTDNAREIVG